MGHPLLIKYGKYVKIDLDRMKRIELLFHRWGALAIVVGRLVPGFRSPTSFMAGLFGVSYLVFLPSTIFSAAIWVLFYFSLGFLGWGLWGPVKGYIQAHAFSSLILGFFFLAAAISAWYWITKQRRAESAALKGGKGKLWLP